METQLSFLFLFDAYLTFLPAFLCGYNPPILLHASEAEREWVRGLTGWTDKLSKFSKLSKSTNLHLEIITL